MSSNAKVIPQVMNGFYSEISVSEFNGVVTIKETWCDTCGKDFRKEKVCTNRFTNQERPEHDDILTTEFISFLKPETKAVIRALLEVI